MACQFEVFLNAGQHPHAAEHVIAALDLVDRLEAQMTVYRETSEISQLNRFGFDAPRIIESRLYDLLRRAQQICLDTSGAFDITAGPLTKVWGFFLRQGKLPTDDEIRSALERVGSHWLQFVDEMHSVRLGRAGMQVNLGAIGKGYALDRCAEQLMDAGVHNFLIHGGHSSILARGSRDGRRGWKVGLRDPLRPERRLGEIELHDVALGTSGAANQFFYHHGRRFGHVIDPRTGWPADKLLSATVLAPTAAEADALATAFYVLGAADVEAFCQDRPDLQVILVSSGPRGGDLELQTIGAVSGLSQTPVEPR
jgi:thiamine biosynthesis lipoprotein